MNPWRDFERLSPEDIRRSQGRRLQNFLTTQIYPFSPHYRKVFNENNLDPRKIKNVEDLKRIPFTSKASFFDSDSGSTSYKDFVLQPDAGTIKKYWPMSKTLPLVAQKIFKGKDVVDHHLAREYRPVFMTFTTGTTRQPVPFLYSNYDMNNLRISGARMVNLFDVQVSDHLVNVFPYAPHLAFWQVVMGGFESCILSLSTGGGKVMGTDGNIAAINKMKPAVLLGVPSYVYHLLRKAQQQNCDFSFLKKIVLGASRVTVGLKKKLAEVASSLGAHDISVFGTYGFTEARCAWSESPAPLDESTGYYLYPDKEIFEVIDPETGEVKGEGEDGELVYTSLDSRSSAMIRYRTGDFVRGGITYSECSRTGLTVPRISSDITRLSDVKDLQLSKIKGALVNLNHFAEILSEISLVDEWQLEIGKKDDDPFEVDVLNLYLCVQKECDRECLMTDIRDAMLQATELSPNRIDFISMEEIVKRLEIETANKEKRIIDKRPKT